MTRVEKERLRALLDHAVEAYLGFMKEPDEFNKPCWVRETNHRQHKAFMLAEQLYSAQFITWEECCEVWTRVGITTDQVDCPYRACKANIQGLCEYKMKERDDEDTVQGDKLPG